MVGFRPSRPYPTLAFPTLPDPSIPNPSRTNRQLIDETMSRDRIEEPLLVRVLYTKFFVQRGEVWECFSRSLSCVSRSGKGREGCGRVWKGREGCGRVWRGREGSGSCILLNPNPSQPFPDPIPRPRKV